MTCLLFETFPLLQASASYAVMLGHLKADYRMSRCRLKGSMGDALHALSSAVGYNLRWLMRAVVRLGLTGFLFAILLTRWMTSSASRYVVYEPQTAHAKMVQA